MCYLQKVHFTFPSDLYCNMLCVAQLREAQRERAVWRQTKAVRACSLFHYLCDDVHSSALRYLHVWNSVCFFKMVMHWPPSTVGNAQTVDKNLRQIYYFKKPELSL